jgi:hypothetical protein
MGASTSLACFLLLHAGDPSGPNGGVNHRFDGVASITIQTHIIFLEGLELHGSLQLLPVKVLACMTSFWYEGNWMMLSGCEGEGKVWLRARTFRRREREAYKQAGPRY